jgi:hypothetical protein
MTVYEAVSGTQGRAQKVIDAAEAAHLASPSGHYIVGWFFPGDIRTLVRAEFDARIPAGRQVIRVEAGSQVEMLLIQADSWSRATVEGKRADCWFHFSRGTSKQARLSAVLPGLYPLLDPQAVGFLGGGTKDQVVVNVLLDEAVPIAAPKLADQLGSAIDPDATVPGVITPAGGEYKSLEYKMVDVVAELELSDPSLAEVLRDQLDASNGSWTVQVDYSNWGAEVTVTAPEPDRVIEMGSPDEVLQSSQSPDTHLPPCEAAR